MLSRKKLIAFSSLLPLLIAFAYVPPVQAQPLSTCPVQLSGACAISVTPGFLKIESNAGTSFTATVLLTNFNISDFDVFFSYNPAVLTATSIGLAPAGSQPAWWCQANCTDTSTVLATITQGTGTVEVVTGLTNGESSNIGSTPLILFTIAFTATHPGSSPLNVPTTAADGSSNPKLTFCSGIGTCNSSVTVDPANYSNGLVIVPPFAITTVPGSLSLGQGSLGTAVVTVSSILGFVGDVNVFSSFAATGFAPNSTLSMSTVTLTAKAPSTSFTINVEAQPCTPIGAYNAVITGKSGSLSNTGSLPLTVTMATVSSFCISANTNAVHLALGGGTASVGISVCSANGFSGTVSLSANEVPTQHHKITEAFKPNPSSLTISSATNDCVAGSPATTMLTITSTKALAAGTYEIAVTGSISAKSVLNFYTVITVVVS